MYGDGIIAWFKDDSYGPADPGRACGWRAFLMSRFRQEDGLAGQNSSKQACNLFELKLHGKDYGMTGYLTIYILVMNGSGGLENNSQYYACVRVADALHALCSD